MSTESRRIRVLLADDHSIMREGLKMMLEQSGDVEVVGQAKDGEEAVRAASELAPDVIVMDVIMPNKDAVIEAVSAGATGYLQKVSGMDRLLRTVRLVAAGEMHLPTEVVRRVFAGI